MNKFVLSLAAAAAIATLGSAQGQQPVNATTVVSQTASQRLAELTSKTTLGVDLTEYQSQLQQHGAYTFYTYGGTNISDSAAFMKYLKDCGVNTVQVKVAVNPSDDDAKFRLSSGIATLKAAQTAGLKTNLVLMYSDQATYANTQTVPAGWQTGNSEQAVTALLQEAKNYTKDVLAQLRTQNVQPTTITLGNEVNYNFLNLTGNDDNAWNGWYDLAQLAQLVKQQSSAKVALSVKAPSQASDMQWLVKALDKVAAAYDQLTLTVYPDSTTTTDVAGLRQAFSGLTSNKQLNINIKTANANTAGTATTTTQSTAIKQYLASTLSSSNAGGITVADASERGSWNSLFDSDGYPLPALAMFNTVQGKTTDTTPDPFRTGADTGLKEQKVKIKKLATMANNTIRGADVSSSQVLKNAGVKFYNFNGKQEPLLKILHDNGVNYIRIRVWNDPKNAAGKYYGGGDNDVATGLKIAKEAKKYHLKVLLDLHYSDLWADPAQQLVPKQWQKDVNHPAKMRQNITNFTTKTLKQFKQTGVTIGMVQIGNEITNGFLGITTNRDAGGSYLTVWNNPQKSKQIDSYLNAGIAAVRKTTPHALVALHLETPSVTKYRLIMKTWARDHVNYDVLGSSYYPYWSNTPALLQKVQKLAAQRGKLFVVLETAWVNSLKDADGTPNSVGSAQKTKAFAVSPQGQVDALTSVYQTELQQSNGLGAFYWEPAWIPVKAGWQNWQYNRQAAEKYGTGWVSSSALGYFPNSKMYYHGKPAWGGSSWDNQGLFDDRGYALQSLKFYQKSIGNKRDVQTTQLNFVTTAGKSIAASQFVQTKVGNFLTVSVPRVKGYTPEVTKVRQKAVVAGVKQVTVKYYRTAKVTREPYRWTATVKRRVASYQNLLTFRKRVVRLAKRRYALKVKLTANGKRYYSLYSLNGKHWYGYVASAAVKLTKMTKKTHKIKQTVQVKSRTVTSYQNFTGKVKHNHLAPGKYLVKVRYTINHHANYYSLYRGKHWYGYVASSKVKLVKHKVAKRAHHHAVRGKAQRQ